MNLFFHKINSHYHIWIVPTSGVSQITLEGSRDQNLRGGALSAPPYKVGLTFLIQILNFPPPLGFLKNIHPWLKVWLAMVLRAEEMRVNVHSWNLQVSDYGSNSANLNNSDQILILHSLHYLRLFYLLIKWLDNNTNRSRGQFSLMFYMRGCWLLE